MNNCSGPLFLLKTIKKLDTVEEGCFELGELYRVLAFVCPGQMQALPRGFLRAGDPSRLPESFFFTFVQFSSAAIKMLRAQLPYISHPKAQQFLLVVDLHMKLVVNLDSHGDIAEIESF